jgi:hypothetical protein
MRSLDDSTLWRFSAYERHVAGGSAAAFASAATGPAPGLSPTLIAELLALERQPQGFDVLTVLSACLRQRENALLLLHQQDLVWPVTLFPREQLYHCPRDLVAQLQGLMPGPAELLHGAADLRLLRLEPAGLQAPGSAQRERVGQGMHYRPLAPLLWALALYGPRAQLLPQIAGHAAYRVAPDYHCGPHAPGGALGAALQRLRQASVPLRELARWPGLSPHSAARLLNALYVQGGLMVSRVHPAARDGVDLGLAGWIRRGPR